MNMPAHAWIASLHGHLDGLERALLQSDASAVERASAAVQAALQQAPRTLELRGTDADALQSAAQRFTQLRAATLRAAALNERALGSLLPDHLQKPTYQPSGLARAGGPRGRYVAA
jgi:hypothetical protein